MLNLTKALTLTIKAREDIAAIFELESMIKEAMSVEIAKSKGNLNIYSALKKILEKAKKDSPDRPSIHGAWLDTITEKQYVSNGFYLIEINTPVEGLPQLENDVTALNPMIYLKDAEYYEKEIPLNAGKIKLQLKQAEAERKANDREKILLTGIGIFELGLSWYSVVLLSTLISVLGADVTVHGLDEPFKPCIITSNIGRAFLMPVRMNAEEESA